MKTERMAKLKAVASRPYLGLLGLLLGGTCLVFAAGFSQQGPDVESRGAPAISPLALKAPPDYLPSKVMRMAQAHTVSGDWGKMHVYFTGESYGSSNIYSGWCVLKPGEALHPSHRHAAEEFLIVTQGSGTWHVNGKDLPARKGDVLFVEPWTWHGLVNTGRKPLTFLVVKWSSKGVPAPPKPAGDNEHLRPRANHRRS